MRIVFLSCPQWDVKVPPYNISLLSTIVKNNGYESKIIDLNLRCYRDLQNRYEEDYWFSKNYFRWFRDHFKTDILPKIEHVIDEVIEEIIAYKPDFVGVSIYGTNIECVKQVINKIKDVDNSIKIMAGGPHCFELTEDIRKSLNIDKLFTGEAENLILDALNNPEERKVYETKQKVDLNDHPFIDYSDIDINDYETAYPIVATEASRGCISKCSFCSETCFWGYKFKSAERLLAELKHYVEKYDIKTINFNDSLINGNIKENKKFVELLSEENLKLKWNTYYRINKKMDLEFFKKAKKSGNVFISFGIESGSQKVLNDMKKNITIEEIENNLRDVKLSDIRGHVNWIIGFPTETCLDYLKSLIFIYNNKDNIYAISPGMTCGIAPKSDLDKNPKKYNIMKSLFFGAFTTIGFKNTIIHRFIRLKLFHIWLDIFDVFNSQKQPLIKNDYSLVGVMKEFSKINYDDCFDFSEIADKSFEHSLISEFLSFFWGLYKTFGVFNMKVSFDYKYDRENFDTSIVAPYNAKVSFHVNQDNSYVFKIDHSLEEDMCFNNVRKIKGKF